MPTNRKGRKDDLVISWQVLLDDALRDLRRINIVMAHTLGAALGAHMEDDCEPHQVARLVSSVSLAIVGIDQLWRGLRPHGY